jgi:putative salt-induced outer membrane protein YdiY
VCVLAGAFLAGRGAAEDLCPCPTPTPPPPDWTGSFGGGLALSGGNSDTKSYNATFAVKYDPKRKNVLTADGLYLRSDNQGQATVDKTALGVRDEYKVGARAFVFGEVRHLRDAFKEIKYLISPIVGAGVNAVDTEKAKLSLDVAVGGQFEEDTGKASTADGALQAGQRLNVKLSDGAALAERGSALWKMSDFGDALYRFEIGLTASVAKRLELKVGFIDDYKTRPAQPLLKKNDTSLVAALVFKIG